MKTTRFRSLYGAASYFRKMNFREFAIYYRIYDLCFKLDALKNIIRSVIDGYKALDLLYEE